MDRIVGGKYKLGRKIGSGSYGEVYEATQIDTLERVAVKIEKGNNRDSSLMEEARIYTILQGRSGIPKILWSGTDEDEKILVLELLGPNLQSLLEKCGGKFTLRTVLLLAIQMIGRIEYVHSKGFLHRDIKPENFVMGVGKKRNQVYIIDFGIAKSYLNPATNRHIPYRTVKYMIGAPRYASWNAHCFNELSRRDDLESLGYVLLYLLRGRLPWQGVRVPTMKQMKDMIFAMKHVFLEVIEPIPTELVYYFEYCNCLNFDQKPDYDYLKQLFYDRYCSEDLCDPKALAGYTSDNYFDWTIFQYQKARRTSASPRIIRRAQLPLPALANPDVPMNHDASSQVQSASSAPVHDPASSVGSSSRQIYTS